MTGNADDVDWFHPSLPGMMPVAPPPHVAARHAEETGYLTAQMYATGTSLQDRPAIGGGMRSAYNDFSVTTQDVLEVLGPDADDLLATANLDVDALISMINAETMMLPRIDEELEALFAAESAPEPEFGKPQPQTESIGKRWKKRFLKAAIGAILLSATGGGGMALAMNKSVTVDIDGHNQQVSTHDATVGQVLADEGIHPGMHDALSPSPSAPVTDGGKIVLERGRLLRLTVDGVEQDHWTRATTVSQALQELGMVNRGAWMSSAAGSAIPLNGMAVTMRTPKAITLMDGANAPIQLTTTDATIGDLLTARHMTLGTGDSVDPGLNVAITADMQIMINRQGTGVVKVTSVIVPPVQTIQDPTLNEGTTTVTNPGTPGSEITTYQVTTVNGRQTKRVQLSVQIVTPAVPKVVRQGTKQLPGDAVWDEIAQCESGGDWSINTGNGYYGGLQFNEPTWDSNGGQAYAPRADLATKAQQIAVADKVRAARGLEPWQCAGELGLD
ncbi:MAG TPA: transglycosylase family protein [Pseudonocardiaceae bacterium]|nr:transglycosylase family protein [Pseudonocardiaceae bacterium]